MEGVGVIRAEQVGEKEEAGEVITQGGLLEGEDKKQIVRTILMNRKWKEEGLELRGALRCDFWVSLCPPAFPLPFILFDDNSKNRKKKYKQNNKEVNVNLIILGLNRLWAGKQIEKHSRKAVHWNCASEGLKEFFRVILRWDAKSWNLPACRAALDDLTKDIKVTYDLRSESKIVDKSLILASKIVLPSAKYKIIPMLALLPEVLQEVYKDEEGLISQECEDWEKARKIKITLRMPRREYVNTLKIMFKLGMIEWREKKEIKMINGLQCVRKDNNKLRLIFDGRPVNCIMQEPKKAELPGLHLLENWFLKEKEIVIFGKIDLDNYYHRIGVPDWLKVLLGLPPVLNGELEEITEGKKKDGGFVCATLPMGLSHAVYIAQEIHLCVLNLIKPELPLNPCVQGRDQSWILLYIDDVLIGTKTEVRTEGEQRVNDIMERICQVYHNKGLEVNKEKIQWADSQLNGLRCEFDGITGVVRPKREKLNKLVQASKQLLSHTWIDRKIIEIILGHWVWFILLRRPCFSILFNVYRLLQNKEEQRILKFWDSVKTEFQTLIWLAGSIFMSWRRVPSDWILATDASLLGGGACEACLTKEQAEELIWKDGGYQGLEKLVLLLEWNGVLQFKWGYKEHINVLEARALVMGLSNIIQTRGRTKSRWLGVVDSLVVLGAVRKGRSSSYALNNQLRRVLGLSLVADAVLDTAWISTDINPADSLSRVFVYGPAEEIRRRPMDKGLRLRARLSEATFHLYLAVWRKFRESSGSTGYRNLDSDLVKFIESLPEVSRKNTAERLLAATNHFYPEKIGSLKIINRYVKQLRRAHPTGTKPPMIEEVVIQIAYYLCRHKMPVTAVAILLQFDCYLRPVEVSNIQARHVAFPGGGILGREVHKVLILLPKTKTGSIQSVDIRSKIVIKALQKLTTEGEKERFIFPSYKVYASRILNALKALNLSHLSYTLHSIRHGGATTDLINLGYKSLAQIMYRGGDGSLMRVEDILTTRRCLSTFYAELLISFINDAARLKYELANKIAKVENYVVQFWTMVG